MKTADLTASTSSRLHRAELPTAAKVQELAITDRTIAYCNAALDGSRFFSLLQAGQVSAPLMQYVFLQYHHWRDRLHQWFGLCIVKAGSCTDPDQKAALLSLSDHIFTDLEDGHSEMYVEFLHDLGLSDDDIAAAQRSAATTAYERSFFDQFSYGTDNFYEALAALSGRELCVSVRNGKILRHYFDARAMKQPTWLSLHAELEVNHFQDSIRPVLIHAEDSAMPARVVAAIDQGIDRHVQYFEDLLQEYESTCKST
ncbi:iron-containing redox enzyme family protein [Nodosilinea nodulosa]|uniref:iron-containing redox enzyme family protein n=1 Tax=Nodosilinea nodulosa TaxID=416001 RepID=UPI0002F49FC7|nr:iron-containing redox enzyme family protein [Nodosilinea nodulosa]